MLLEYLSESPILTLDLRLGEGTGCALVYPILESAIGFVNQMASFEEAGVSKES
jgi:nicotinate-nucleotide--dimethylbenzimidazole phosphoribosyltransferase